MESRVIVLKNLFTGQQWRNRHREKINEHGEGEERMRCMERVMWKLTLPYVKSIASRNLLYGSGNSNRGSVINLEEWMGRNLGGRFKREGIYVYLWLIYVEV